jgi:MOSC domain-containing protein YiiM
MKEFGAQESRPAPLFRNFSRPSAPWGVLGENFSTEGILEDQIKVGDHIRLARPSSG